MKLNCPNCNIEITPEEQDWGQVIDCPCGQPIQMPEKPRPQPPKSQLLRQKPVIAPIHRLQSRKTFRKLHNISQQEEYKSTNIPLILFIVALIGLLLFFGFSKVDCPTCGGKGYIKSGAYYIETTYSDYSVKRSKPVDDEDVCPRCFGKGKVSGFNYIMGQ